MIQQGDDEVVEVKVQPTQIILIGRGKTKEFACAAWLFQQ
jgi:hypothetical protein